MDHVFKKAQTEYFRLCRQLSNSAMVAESSQKPCIQAQGSHVPINFIGKHRSWAG